MTNDELIALKKEAKEHAVLLQSAGLHRSRVFTLLNSDFPIIVDQLIRARSESTISSTSEYDNNLIEASND
jgi:hypothetical protein